MRDEVRYPQVIPMVQAVLDTLRAGIAADLERIYGEFPRLAERRDQVVDPQLPSCCPGAGPAARSVASIVAALWPLPARVSRAIALASGSSPARMRPVA